MQGHLIQIRHVPAKVHRVLKARAAQEGMTLSDYLLRHLTLIAERPTVDAVLERIRSRDEVEQSLDSASTLRAEREGRQ